MSRRSAFRAAALCGLALAAALSPDVVRAQATAAAPAALRWTAETPDEMLDFALKRAQAGGDDALAGLLVAATMDDRAAFGKARAGLDAIAMSTSPLADDARWLSERLKPDPKPATWSGARVASYDAPASPSGLVTAFS